MRQWDYLFVTILMQVDGRLCTVMVNGVVKDYPRGQGPLLQEYLAALTAEGWEKVSAVGGRTFIFQRLRWDKLL
jgi:hypothetical protein